MSLFAEAIRAELAAIVRDAVNEALNARNGDPKELIGPQELADRLRVPVTWVYEQSRLGTIPTHRLGKYIRFDFVEVVESQKEKTNGPRTDRAPK